MGANDSFRKEEVRNYLQAYDGKIIRLIRKGVTHISTVFFFFVCVCARQPIAFLVRETGSLMFCCAAPANTIVLILNNREKKRIHR